MRPSSLLGLSSTDPAALLIDLGIAHRATQWEIREGLGDHWWISVLKAFSGSGSEARATDQPKAPQKVRWL